MGGVTVGWVEVCLHNLALLWWYLYRYVCDVDDKDGNCYETKDA